MTTATQLADELTGAILAANPVAATLLGVRDWEDQLPDFSEAGEAAASALLRDILARAGTVDPAGLTDQQLVTLAVVRAQVRTNMDIHATRSIEYKVTDTFFAPAIGLLSMLSMTGITEPAHAEGYLARLAGLPAALAAIADRHRAGAAASRVPVRRLAVAAVSYLDRYLAGLDADPLRRPSPPAGGLVPVAAFESERDRILAEVVHPALARYRDVLHREVVPPARGDDKPGLCWLPGGEQDYVRLVRAYTTTGYEPTQVHQIGLATMAELREQYAAVGSRLFGTGDIGDLFTRVRTDPALRWRDGDQLLVAARAAISRAEQVVPDWFSRVPSHSCRVVAIPEDEATGAPASYYYPPSLDGSRPGTYFANTRLAPEQERVTGEAKAFQQGVPGHHLQLALAQELTDLPLLRRLISVAAYSQGWGAYAEWLADEMGLYTGDLARLGMLSQELLRAARLVVDTGLHAYGWDRRRVVDYLRANTVLPPAAVESETDRYMVTPGQSLAFLLGRLEIQRMRAEAERALGERFNVRSFHDAVLGSGALPLTVLNEVVRAWVTRVANQVVGRSPTGQTPSVR